MSNTWIVKKRFTVDSESAINGITLDNNGNIYFTMGQDGLWRLNTDDTNMKPQCIKKDGSGMTGIVWNGNNMLYVCDCSNHRILSYSIDTGTLSILAGKYGHQDGNVKDASFADPWGIAMDRNGDLYITELDRIRKINIESGTVETIAGPTGSWNDCGHQDGETKNATFDRPTGIAISDDGAIYVCDRHNYCIRQIKNGVVSTLAGTPGKKGYKDGTLRDSMFSDWIGGLAMTDDGSLLVTDCDNGLRKVDIQVSTPQDLQVIRNPISLTTDNEGNIYCGTFTSPPELWKITSVINESHLKSSLNNMTTWKHIRLFLVGDSGAGKTSLVRWLKGEKFNPKHTSTDSVEVSTTDANTWQSSTFDIKDYMADVIKHRNNASTNSPLFPKRQNSENDNVPAPTVSNSNGRDSTTKEALHNSTNSGSGMVFPSNVNNSHGNSSSKFSTTQPKLGSKILSEITELIRTNKQLSASFHVWDFAGQEEYYNTHHFFLSEAAIYLLVIDISKPINKDKVKFWLDLITFYAPNSDILIVGTHRDCLNGTPTQQEEQAMKVLGSLSIFKEGAYCIKKIMAVSCKEDDSSQVRAVLKQLAEQNLNQSCKLSWMVLYDAINQAADEKSPFVENNPLTYLNKATAVNIANQFGMASDEVENALQFYQQNGFITNYPDDNLHNIIFTKPQQVIDMLKTVITVDRLNNNLSRVELNLLKQEGRLHSTSLQRLWSCYPPEIHPQLRTLLHKFGLAFDDPLHQNTTPDLIIPSQVDVSEDHQLATMFDKPAFQVNCCIHTITSLGYANKLIPKIIGLVGDVDSCCVFKNGCMFGLGGVKYRIKTSLGQVTMEGTQKIVDNSDSWKNLLKILQLVYSTAVSYKKTIQIATEALCFICNQVSVVVNIQRGIFREDTLIISIGHYKKFCCQNCWSRILPIVS